VSKTRGRGGILENAISRTRMRSCIASNALAISIAGVVCDRAREAGGGDKSGEAAAGRASGVIDAAASDADGRGVSAGASSAGNFDPTPGKTIDNSGAPKLPAADPDLAPCSEFLSSVGSAIVYISEHPRGHVCPAWDLNSEIPSDAHCGTSTDVE
jgi:hypothetical protein